MEAPRPQEAIAVRVVATTCSFANQDDMYHVGESALGQECLPASAEAQESVGFDLVQCEMSCTLGDVSSLVAREIHLKVLETRLRRTESDAGRQGSFA